MAGQSAAKVDRQTFEIVVRCLDEYFAGIMKGALAEPRADVAGLEVIRAAVRQAVKAYIPNPQDTDANVLNTLRMDLDYQVAVALGLAGER